MNNLILTTKGKLKIKQYIEICKKKKKRILELGLDTAEKTKIRSLTDIYIELNVDPYVIDAEGVTYSFYITDHICEKLSLTLNIDYVKGINIDYLKSISIGVREKTKMVSTNIV